MSVVQAEARDQTIRTGHGAATCLAAASALRRPIPAVDNEYISIGWFSRSAGNASMGMLEKSVHDDIAVDLPGRNALAENDWQGSSAGTAILGNPIPM